MSLQTRIDEISRVYKAYSRRLEKLGIKTLEDFLYHIPFRYENYSLISPIANVQEGEIVTVKGTVTTFQNQYTRSRKTIQKAVISDSTGNLEVIWFNQPYLSRVIHEGESLSLSGKVKFFARKIVLESPEYEIVLENQPTLHTGRLVPIYSETRGVSSKWLRRQVFKILSDSKGDLVDYLPETVRKKLNLEELQNALWNVHFPETIDLVDSARERLGFDELLLVQLASLSRKSKWENQLKAVPFEISNFKQKIEEFWEQLPFELTGAQKKAVGDIFKDLASSKPMNRLLEGDVGSGKTVVSAIAMYLAHLNGYQSTLMAPTEILANQHFRTISNLLTPLKVKVDLATGSKKLKKDDFNILIGTHALLNKKVQFNKLGLVVIDEQQRFGVEQRAIIREKGKSPHLLTMTATPIPRTVALTLYGDLDLSFLDEMPKGRQIIKTWLVPDTKRADAYAWIEKQIKDTKSQAFIICPFIEESESMQTVRAATKEYEYLKNEVFPTLNLGLLHGKLKSKEKDTVLNDFKEKKHDILIATPVVEVGIDIPNATIMVIEASERFGLAQLHQLRGRVGRGNKQSYCLLFTESKNPQTTNRLKSLEITHVGAELAELDLRLRGPGDIYGTAQHGALQLKIASFSDFPLIEKTRKEAEELFSRISNFPLLQKKLNSLQLKQVSPD